MNGSATVGGATTSHRVDEVGNRKKVVIHLHEPEPDGEIGGADLHVLELTRALSTAGNYAPFVVTTQSNEFSQRLREANIPYRSTAGRSCPLLRVPFELRNLPTEIGACLVHSHGYESDYLAVLLATLAPQTWGRIPLVTTCHGWIQSRLKLRIKTTMDFWSYRWSSSLIVCAEAQRPMLERRAPNKPIYYVPNGVDESIIAAGERSLGDDLAIARETGTEDVASHPPLVCFVGRLADEKRVLDFVRIAARVAQRIPTARFAIAGAGPLAAAVRRLATGLRIHDRLELLGLVKNMRNLYGRMTILVLPSETETTSRVTIEAGMNGIPVVASRVGGVPELIADGVNGFLCNPGAIDEFTQRCVALLSDARLLLAMRREAREHAVTRFSLETMRARVERVYEETLSAQRPTN